VKFVAYTRTSWAEQVQESFPSIESQEAELRKFAEKTGIKLGKVYSDVGLSPTQGTCAGLISILDTMNEDWVGVLVTQRDRLEDMPSLSFDAMQELRQNGRKVFVADSATAKILKTQRPKATPRPSAAKADEAHRRKEIAARLFKGREAGAKAGKHQSGPAPFGYRRDYSKRVSDGVLLVPSPEEAEVVKMIFREYLRLRSMKRLIRLLDEHGLRTRRGKQWSRAGVSWILKNDTYVGRVHFGNIRVRGRHESIIPPILFNKVQKLIRANNKRNRRQIKAKDAEREAETKAKAKAKAKAKVTPVAKAKVATTVEAKAGEPPVVAVVKVGRKRQTASSGSGLA
jgi:site-specific DNA recombinase